MYVPPKRQLERFRDDEQQKQKEKNRVDRKKRTEER
jgi:hypothetical protein